jgi:riboflavin biosynthesis pyrimidine reductase
MQTVASTSEGIDQRLASLFGEVDWRAARGLLQIAAISASTRAVLAIGPHAPRSATDRFVLGFARARADVIVTTGAILRAEPDLVHRTADDPDVEAAFRIWRASILGKLDPPSLIVLSRSGDLPLDHPAIAAAASGIVWTSREGRARLGPLVGPLAVEPGAGSIDAQERGSDDGRGLIDALALGRFETVLLEAGPRTTRVLYASRGEAPAVRLDELLLSRFEGPVAPAALGPPFVSEAALTARFPRPATSVRVEEPSGVWRFDRYRTDPPR